ncbi:four helix bundle protein [Endomicrobium proavitum]|uniref:Four helix bundle protein n=1 Tax=Endomicrobium proavitum TaxID=1408281 RepID=A0A0G3WKA3_9BACT|nr:four helix bundle protein [Endomicrobium proavitum]AKL98307.1 hypothetical protein Epro_0928 [Endomicrobium proavitum]
MKDNIVKDKSKIFAIEVINLYKYLYDVKKEFVMSKQLLRSGTSIGANIAESECAISRKDFLLKIYISLKECAETKYWLELLYATKFINEKEFANTIKNCEELRRILSATTKTVRTNLNKKI